MTDDLSDTGPFQLRSLESVSGREKERGDEAEVKEKPMDAFEAMRSEASTLVVVADFTPPPSHQTQMLRLRVGEQVTVLGQDGTGWWYGKKPDNGEEGWFPPSYLQVKAAHFSSAGVAPPSIDGLAS